jgi:APA family basic amino acid/polyamine antiporter
LAGSTTTGVHASGLRRILGLGFGLAVIIGGTLGVGILRAPGLVAGQLHVPAVILGVWVVGGLYTLLSSVCLTELGGMAPEAGGYYIYARRAFGDRVGFAVGWTDWITYCSVLGYVSIGMSEFLATLAPALAGSVRPVAIVLLVAFVGLQWAGVRVSSQFQEWTTVLKCVAFLALIIAGVALAGGRSAAPAAAAPLPPMTLSGLVAALQVVIIAYGGWQSALYFTEEDRDPNRNLPREMIGGVVVVTIIYVLVNVALLVILPVPELARSTLPAASAAAVIVGERGGQLITILSVISLPPLLNAIMMIGTRILFALGRDRLVWSRTAEVNASGTPGIATLVTTVVAIGLIATGTFQQLVAVTSFFLALNATICCLALFVLRRTEPAAARPFRAWGYPVSPAIVVIGAVWLLAITAIGDTRTAVLALGVIAVGLVGHAVHRAVAPGERR